MLNKTKGPLTQSISERGECPYQEVALLFLEPLCILYITFRQNGIVLFCFFSKARTYQSVVGLADQIWGEDYEALTVLNEEIF